MSSKREMEKYAVVYLLAAVLLILLNLYYYSHPVLSSMNMTNRYVDTLIFRMRAGGIFDSPYGTKFTAFLLLFLGVMTTASRRRDVSLRVLLPVSAAGLLLYFLPFWRIGPYVLTTVSGTVLLTWSLSRLMQKVRNDQDLNGEETFEQCTRLIETPDSINIPHRFRYQGRKQTGWINVVNPFRATMILGNPGSGKSYSVYEPFIEQMTAKGYSMFVYDYKYPSLSLKVYNELMDHMDRYPVRPEFCVIDMNSPLYSHRCNPLHPRYIKDPADASEIAELIMLNVNKAAIEKEDFFTQSAKVMLESVIWFLRQYEDGRYCTFPHVIEFMTQDYKQIISILLKYPEIEARMKPFANALRGNAQDQLQGQLASAQIPLLKFVSRSLYWTLTGDDFSLELNDPEHPKVLCVGNDPDRQMIYGTTIALITSRMFKTINKPHKLKCGVLLDEFPTVYLKGIDNLIATARSNKVAVVIGAQDKSQIRRDYGEKESEVIFNTVGNMFAGQVSGKTAESLSRTFGKELRDRDSVTVGSDSDSVNTSGHETEMMPIRKIETLTQGVFIGKVADNNQTPIDRKLFCGEILRDSAELARKRKGWKSIPRMTDFGEDELEEKMRSDPKPHLLKHIMRSMLSDGLLYQEDILKERAEKIYGSLSKREKLDMLDAEVELERRLVVDRCIQNNFLLVQKDVQNIISNECRCSQKMNPRDQDPRIDDAMYGL